MKTNETTGNSVANQMKVLGTYAICAFGIVLAILAMSAALLFAV